MSDERFFSIIDYEVDGPTSQQQLIDAFVDVQERWVRSHDGYLSARLLASVDGRRVYNLITWASEEQFRRFEEESDTEGRMAALAAAVEGVSGWAEPRMTGPPRFRQVAEVHPPS